MGKYTNYMQTQRTQRRWNVHPIWRGIGCILIILVPTLSYFAARLLVRENLKYHYFGVPLELNRNINWGPVLRFLPGLSGVFEKIGPIYLLDLALTLAFIIIGFGILTLVYSALYRAMGPSRFSAVDSPPVGRAPRQ